MTNVKILQSEIKDFFRVYFDKSIVRRISTPEVAMSYIRDYMSSTHMSMGRLQQFAIAIKKIQLWQESILQK